MSDGIEAAELAELFATPPPEFVATRNALAKKLRADQRRDAAALIAKVRRPGWVDWALNAVAAAEPSVVAGFADAAEVLREAQAASIEGRDGPDLRGGLKALRDATAALGRRAGAVLADAGRSPDTAEVAARLGEVAAQPEAVAQLRSGVLGSADPSEEDVFAGLTPAGPAEEKEEEEEETRAEEEAAAPAKRRAAPAGRKATASRSAGQATRAGQPRKPAKDAAGRDDAAQAERRRAAEEAAARRVERMRLEEAVRTAARRRDEAAGEFATAQRALDAARAALDDADAALDAARADLEHAADGTLAP